MDVGRELMGADGVDGRVEEAVDGRDSSLDSLPLAALSASAV